MKKMKMQFPDFSEPSQPLYGSAVRRETKVSTIVKREAQEVAPQETASEAPLVPVMVMPSDKDEMNQLHRQMMGDGRTTLMTGMTLGELLTKKKASLKRGDWGKWVEANLVFDIRMAQNYMNLHKNRATLLEKYETAVAHFGVKGACRLLAKPSKKSNNPPTLDTGEIVPANVPIANPTPKNAYQTDSEPPPSQMKELTVPELTPEQSAQVLDVMKDQGIDPAVYELLRARGGVIRLTAMPEEITPDLADAVEQKNSQEVTHE